MMCLLCLLNEGTGFETKDVEILLNLLKLPKEFSQNLEGSQYCRSCSVKLQLIGLINKEITNMKEKLKAHETEMKEVFVNSFNVDSTEIDQFTTQARYELVKGLGITVRIEKDEENCESFDGHLQDARREIKIPSSLTFNNQNENFVAYISDFAEFYWNLNAEGQKTYLDEPKKHKLIEQISFHYNSRISEIEIKSLWQPDDPNENGDVALADSLQVQPILNCVQFGQNVEFQNPGSFYVKPKIPNDESTSHSTFEQNQFFSAIQSSLVESSYLDNSNLTKTRNSKTSPVKFDLAKNPNAPTSKLIPKNSHLSINYQHSQFPKIRKLRSSLCFMCKPKIVEFERPAEYEEHLKRFHPLRAYSKCPKCHKIIAEHKGAKQGSKNRLKRHMKNVHTQFRPYECEHCKASFKSRDGLNAHIETHLDGEMYICNNCNSEVLGLRNFKCHLNQHK